MQTCNKLMLYFIVKTFYPMICGNLLTSVSFSKFIKGDSVNI